MTKKKTNTTTTTTTTRMGKREMLTVAILAMTAGVNSLTVSNPKTRRQQRSSALYYRGGDSATISIENPLTSSTATTSTVVSPTLPQHVELGLPDQQLLEETSVENKKQLDESMEQLRHAMANSFYTDSEILKLHFAIEEAAHGDSKLMSEAADFCYILTDTMEMGIHVLIAAAFHYCGNDEVQKFGPQVVELFQNAASLEKLQDVFSSVVHHTHGRWDHLRNLLLTDTRDWRALAIRAAACLHRVRSEEKAACREALHTFAPLATRLGMHRLKNELEGEAFRVLYPRQYAAVTLLSSELTVTSTDDDDDKNNTIAERMQQVLQSAKKDMEAVLSNDKVFSSTTERFEVTARVKEPYSMWRKMLRQGSGHVLNVPDAIALRIVLKSKQLAPQEPEQVSKARERALCYYAQHLCQQTWAPLEDDAARIKDYIENPKANGYQSLHYTARNQWKGERWNMEIQVRSEEMHKVAEYGLAAHWDYKSSQSSSSKQDYSSDAYLASLQEWHWEQKQPSALWDAHHDLMDDPFHPSKNEERNDFIQNRAKQLEPYLEALNKAKLTLEEQYKFIFINSVDEGSIIALPAQARVYDAIEESERQTGKEFVGKTLLLNGFPVSHMNQSTLENGDVLTLQL